MGYVLYSTVFLLIGLATAAIVFRSRWIHVLPPSLASISIPGSNYIYARLPSSFTTDIEDGFSSSTFDLAGNVASGDSRAGLDDGSKREIQKIMKNRRVNFDEARRIYTEGRFAKNGIGPDGRPRDPKFVSFS